MSAPSIASRSRQPNRPPSDEVLLARAYEFSAWARRNIRMVIAGSVLALALVGGLLYWRIYSEQRLQRAASEFMQLEQTVASGNAQLAQRDLERYINRFEGTPYADEASVLLGTLLLQDGKPKEAVAALQGVADEIGDSPVGEQAALLTAAAQQRDGDANAAIQTYLRVADEADLDFRKQEALTAAALLRMQGGDNAGAAELYRRAVELTEEGSLERSVLEMRLAEAEAQAAAK